MRGSESSVGRGIRSGGSRIAREGLCIQILCGFENKNPPQLLLGADRSNQNNQYRPLFCHIVDR